MTAPHFALVLLMLFLPIQGCRIAAALRRGERRQLAWLVPGVIFMTLLCVGFSLWPTSPEQIFGSLAGVLRFVGGALLMASSIPFMRRCHAAMSRR